MTLAYVLLGIGTILIVIGALSGPQAILRADDDEGGLMTFGLILWAVAGYIAYKNGVIPH